MSSTLLAPEMSKNDRVETSIKPRINQAIDTLIASLPGANQLREGEGRGIIARYSAVLEGNFIYWMTATLIAVKAEEAKPILLENLYEEVRDAHPDMLRRFAIAANAFPSDKDALAVHEELTQMRLFLGRLSAVQSLAAMAFFEGFIQRFMGYLAELAAAAGSREMEYTDVHGVCDIAHTDGLFRALSAEMAVNPPTEGIDLLEGVNLLRGLMETVIFGGNAAHA